jgi:hypothetical protein
LLVTSEMTLSKLQLSTELSTEKAGWQRLVDAWLTAKCWLTGFS